METTVKTKKAVKKVEEKVSYLVKTKGYKETFTTLDQARNQLEVLKRRAIKSKNSIKIQIHERKKGQLADLIDEVQISEMFFDAD